MEKDIVYYHKLLQKNIHAVERDETDSSALNAVSESFLKVFEMIKMIMISKKDRYYGCFLMNFDLQIDYSMIYEACVSIDEYPFQMAVNPLLLGLHPLPVMVYMMCHEIEHIVLNHPAELVRLNHSHDPAIRMKLNLAMDASVNDRLNYEINNCGFTAMSEPPNMVTSKFLVDFFELHFKEMQAFDYYYEHIPDRDAEAGSGRLLIIVRGGVSKEIITAKKRKGMIPIHSWTRSDSAEDIESLIRKFVSDVCDGMSDSTRSNLPNHQKEALNKLLAPPKVSWQQILKRYIGTIPDGYRKTRTRLSRRQPERYDVSGRISDRIIKLVIAIDTSGSMSKDLLESIFNR